RDAVPPTGPASAAFLACTSAAASTAGGVSERNASATPEPTRRSPAPHVSVAVIGNAAGTTTFRARRRSGCPGRSCGNAVVERPPPPEDRKSTRLNSSHQIISYAVFCLKKKKQKNTCNNTTAN